MCGVMDDFYYIPGVFTPLGIELENQKYNTLNCNERKIVMYNFYYMPEGLNSVLWESN